MKHISILVPETAVPAAIVDPRYMFTAVNQFFREAGHQPFFEVSLVGLTESVELLDGLMTMHPNKVLQDVISTV